VTVPRAVSFLPAGKPSAKLFGRDFMKHSSVSSKSDHQSNGDRLLACAFGVLVLLGCGTAYRTVAGQLHGDNVDRCSLNSLPSNIGAWQGRDTVLDVQLVQGAHGNSHATRAYSRPGRRESVSLFVTQSPDLQGFFAHRPAVCYPAAGWILRSVQDVSLQADDNAPLSARVHRFEKTGLVNEQLAVLSYYLVDGQYCPEISSMRARASWPHQVSNSSAQVQIVAGGNSSWKRYESQVKALAVDSARAVRSLLTQPDAVAQRSVTDLDDA
jgi:hypothetical protein